MTYHYRQVPQEKREALIEKTKKLIVDGGFKVSISHIIFVSSILNLSINICKQGKYLIFDNF